ncbi:MAG TPA: hydroxyethylthiazole kinase, partial [Mobilitalea sp.]|nr:hydroxyethylthiazole kinase [Mobilitalea sp.]
ISDCVNEDNLSEVIQFAKSLSMRTGAVIVITGSTDIIADKDKANIVRNGHPMMSKISGTGCMLTSVIGAFCAANPADIMEASTAATCAMGICGELAYKRVVKDESGTSSLKVHLIDYMSKLDLKLLDEWARVKVR